MSTCDFDMDVVGRELSEPLAGEAQRLVHALCAQRRSAWVMGADRSELDRVALALLRRLRLLPQVRVEVVRPTSTEALMGRFNDLVASMPLDVARQKEGADQPLTVWVMHLSRGLELPEIKLLLDMVQGFPGTGIRLLLLCSHEAATGCATQVAARWGSRLHCWVLRPGHEPAPGPAVHAGTSYTPGAALPSSPGPVRVSASPVQARWACLRWRAAALSSGHGALQLRGLRDLRRLKGLGAVLMMLGAAVAAWWYSKAVGGEAAHKPQRRPVPEIVELLDDTRPQVVRREPRS